MLTSAKEGAKLQRESGRAVGMVCSLEWKCSKRGETDKCSEEENLLIRDNKNPLVMNTDGMGTRAR